jgi:chromosome segregation ATPase
VGRSYEKALKCKRSLNEKIPSSRTLADILSAWCLVRIRKDETSTSMVEGSKSGEVLDLSYQIQLLSRKRRLEFEKATLWNELSECEQQCTSVQQALTSLQFQLKDAQGRQEGLTMELEQLLLAQEDWVHRRKKLEEELEELG